MPIEKKVLDRKQPETSPRLSILRKYLRIYSEVYSKEITPTLAAIYDRSLSDLGADTLEQSCAACLAQCRYMPTPADIRQQVDKLNVAKSTDRALIEWEAILKHARKWIPDIGWGSPGYEIKPPALSPQGEWSLRQVGGYVGIAQCGYDETAVMFRKRDFDAAWLRYNEMEKTGYTPLTEGEAQKILEQVPGYKRLKSGKKEIA